MTETITPKHPCTRDEARDYFNSKGLRYSDITEDDIHLLVEILKHDLRVAMENGETSITGMYVSDNTNIHKREDGTIASCFLRISSYYFADREGISFHSDGFIGIAGWADRKNTKPILQAFIQWCDIMKN